MLTGPERFTRLEDLYAALSNAEMAAVLDGGSARVVVAHAGEDWLPAWVDIDGLWIDDPSGEGSGYVSNLGAWLVDRAW
jgi:hypothetical protein